MCLQLANALIFSHLDYGNSLLVNLPANTLHHFQRILNFTAKLICGTSKYDSSFEALKELHILPIHVRCEFNLLVMVYKSLNNLAPSYLSGLLSMKISSYATRSSAQTLLHAPFTKKKIFADRAFSVAGPNMWNQLPESIRSSPNLVNFKNKLKTFLFQRKFC